MNCYVDNCDNRDTKINIAESYYELTGKKLK